MVLVRIQRRFHDKYEAGKTSCCFSCLLQIRTRGNESEVGLAGDVGGDNRLTVV
jgi:hypothetical protein